jgi:hypothetical protein
MATGENSGTWGNVTNVNLGTAIEQAMVESATVTFASANVTLTLTDTNAAQNARAFRLNLTGTTGGARDLIVPAIQKPYIVNNGTADTITVKVSGQTGIAVPASKTMLVYNNGTDVVDAINHLSALSLGTALPIASGGTGSTSTTYANLESNVSGTLPVANGGTGATSLTSEAVVIGNTAGAVKFVSPGTDGNVLTSNGTAWVSEALAIPAGVPVGGMVTFAGATDTTYPGSTFLECNGQVVSQTTYSTLYDKVGLLPDGLNGKDTFTTLGTISTDTFTNVQGIAYNGTDLYVAVGYRKDAGTTFTNFAWTSTDAITWTARTPGGSGDGSNGGILLAVVYGNNLWVASGVGTDGGTNANLRTSTDGITWTSRTVGVAGDFYINDFAGPSGGRYLGWQSGNSGNGSRFRSSTDGITWTAATGNTAATGFSGGISPRAFVGNDTVVCAFFNGDGNVYPYISTSTDYVNFSWVHNYTPSETRWTQGPFWSPTLNLFMGGFVGFVGPAVVFSPDGYNWNSVDTEFPFYTFFDLPNEGIVVAVGGTTGSGNNYRAAITSDGYNWSYVSDPTVFTLVNGQGVITGPNISVGNVKSHYITVGNKLLITGNLPTNSGNRNVMAADIYTYDTTTNFSVPYASKVYGISGTTEKTFIKATE